MRCLVTGASGAVGPVLDVGSAFLGYSFAAVAAMAASTEPRVAVAGILAVWPFVFDSVFTLLQRLRRRERVWEAHRSHLYQRSIACGAAHARVAIEYAASAAVGAIAATLWVTGLDDRGLGAIGAAAAVGVCLWLSVMLRERGHVPVAPHA